MTVAEHIAEEAAAYAALVLALNDIDAAVMGGYGTKPLNELEEAA